MQCRALTSISETKFRGQQIGLDISEGVWFLLQDCGHDAVNDEALFDSAARPGEPPARPPAGVTGLAFDERMTMHAEQSSAPHPERPDRIRAVIARLQASGLAGVCAVALICMPVYVVGLWPTGSSHPSCGLYML